MFLKRSGKGKFHYPLTISALALSVTLSLPAFALDCSWGGGIGDWFSANWSGCGGASPSVTDEATIGSGTVTLDANQSIQSFTLTGGTFTGSGTVTAADQVIFSNGTMSGEGTTRAEGGLLLDGGFSDIWGNRTLVNVGGQTA
ncbi:MAG: hypothetical protein ABW139_12355, partial [Candidatus Thiodiazotropha sp. DIVDIV]